MLLKIFERRARVAQWVGDADARQYATFGITAVADSPFSIVAEVGEFETLNPLTGRHEKLNGSSVSHIIAAFVVKDGWNKLSFPELADTLKRELNQPMTEEQALAHEGSGRDFSHEVEVHLVENTLGVLTEAEEKAKVPLRIFVPRREFA